MMKWVHSHDLESGESVYNLENEDGTFTLSATTEHEPLKRYLAWVEAGNDPDEFWTQTEGLI